MDKAEKKVAAAAEELSKAERVLRHDDARGALADRFRFDASGAATHELKGEEWAVRPRALSAVPQPRLICPSSPCSPCTHAWSALCSRRARGGW